MAEIKQEPMSKSKLEYLRTQRTKEMRQQMVSFGMMIFLTFVAFGMVAMDLDPKFAIPIVLFMAVVQVILQFYYFMHMKDKGHEFAKLFIMTGMYFGIAFIVTFLYITWIGSPI